MLSLVFYTDRFIKPWAAATTYGPIICIRPEHKGDEGLLQHEKVHVRQWYRTLGLHGILYTISKKYRLSSEIEAYAVSLKYYPSSLDHYAKVVAENYGVGVGVDVVKAMLEKEMR